VSSIVIVGLDLAGYNASHIRDGGFMSSILPVLWLLCASASAPPHAPLAATAGDVSFRHERVGSQHLLRLSIGGRIIDSDAERLARMVAFAESFAAQQCQSAYGLRTARHPSWPDVGPILAVNMVFSCLPDRPARSVVTARG
jgi:hypothetical protein